MPYEPHLEKYTVTIAKASEALLEDKANSSFVTTLFKTKPLEEEIHLPLAEASIEEMRMAEKALEEKNPLQPFDYPVVQEQLDKKLGVVAMSLVTTVAAGTGIDTVKTFQKANPNLSTGGEAILTSLALGTAIAYGYGMKMAYSIFQNAKDMLPKVKTEADSKRAELLKVVKTDITVRENREHMRAIMNRDEPSSHNSYWA